MMVGFILKKRSSLNHTVMPPNATTRTRVTICIFASLPVRRHNSHVVKANSGTKSAVTTMKPEYSLPPMVKLRSRSTR